MENDTPHEHKMMFDLEDQITLVNQSVTDDLDREIISECHLRFNQPAIVAQVMMQNMSDPMLSSPDRFTEGERVFWARVAVEMGPDWIAKFRRIGAFMAAVDKA